MNQETRKSYQMRVTQANRGELLVILYEIFLDDIKGAKKARGEEFEAYIIHAQKCIIELIATLDFHYPIARTLYQLYLYVNAQLIRIKMKKQIVDLQIVEDIMTKLANAFQEAAKQDHSAALMENAQKVYAGLTYGRGRLEEVWIDPKGELRGYEA